jgi:hypothetical protein
MRLLVRVVCLLVWLAALSSAQESVSCPGTLPSRLAPGEEARVTPGGSNNVRDLPSRSGTRVGELPAGTVFTVLEGPVCADNLAWYRVSATGVEGWTVESVEARYALEPMVAGVPADALAVTDSGVSVGFPLALADDRLTGISAVDVLASGVPFVRLSPASGSPVHISVYDAAIVERRYPTTMTSLAARAAGEASPAFEDFFAQGVYDLARLRPETRPVAHIEVLPVGEDGSAVRYVALADGSLVYQAFGLVNKAGYYVHLTADFALDPALAAALAAAPSPAEALAELPLEAIDARIPLLDQALASVRVDEGVTAPVLSQPGVREGSVCGRRVALLEVEGPAVQILESAPVRIRETPGGTPTGAEVPPGTLVWVVGAAQCVGDVLWWPVALGSAPLERVGWVAEHGDTMPFFELAVWAGLRPVAVDATGRLIVPTPGPDLACLLEAAAQVMLRERPTLAAEPYAVLPPGTHTAAGVYYDDVTSWYWLGPSTLSSERYAGNWVPGDAVVASAGCAAAEPLYLEAATVQGIVCDLTFAVETNLRSAPDGSLDPITFVRPGTYRAAEQFERRGEGFRWWRLSRDANPFVYGAQWVREDFVQESGECAALPSQAP